MTWEGRATREQDTFNSGSSRREHPSRSRKITVHDHGPPLLCRNFVGKKSRVEQPWMARLVAGRAVHLLLAFWRAVCSKVSSWANLLTPAPLNNRKSARVSVTEAACRRGERFVRCTGNFGKARRGGSSLSTRALRTFSMESTTTVPDEYWLKI